MSAPRRLTLIQQNDTHAHIDPHWELRWRDGTPEVWRAGGYAHIRALADQIRGETGGACIHIDSGDALHGTGPAQWTDGAAIVPALNAVGVEIMAPGNWEFGFGPDVLRRRRGELFFPMIACNVQQAESGEPEFAATEIRQVANLRVAFIGITSPIVSRTMPRPFGAGLRFLDAEDALPQIITRVREEQRPDLVVLISHYGFAQEVEIAKRIGGIDVILGGHTHDVLRAPVVVGRTLITQSGAHGSYITRIDLSVSNGRVCDWSHQLIPVTSDGPTDASVEDVVEQTLRPHRDTLDEVVGRTSMLLHRGTVLEASMDNMITAAYGAATGADVSLSHGWRYGTPVPPGPITMGDLWQMIPTNPELFTIAMTGAELWRMLEASIEKTFAADTLRQQGGYVMRFSGMRAVARLNNPAGTRVQQLEIGGAPADSAHEYTVAAAGAQSVSRQNGRTMTGVRSIDALVAYLRRGEVSTPVSHRRLIAI